jgi:hypothetical protein
MFLGLVCNEQPYHPQLKKKHNVLNFVLVQQWACHSKSLHCCNYFHFTWYHCHKIFVYKPLSVVSSIMHSTKRTSNKNSVEHRTHKQTRHKTGFHVALHTHTRTHTHSEGWPGLAGLTLHYWATFSPCSDWRFKICIAHLNNTRILKNSKTHFLN